MRIRRILSNRKALIERFWLSVHNQIGHPWSDRISLVALFVSSEKWAKRLDKLAELVHDLTLPDFEEQEEEE